MKRFDYEKLPTHIYCGENETQLNEILGTLGALDIHKTYDYVDPPCGHIIVRDPYLDTWIAQKKSFYGWNVLSY